MTQRQDEFLRDLQKIAQINRKSNTPDYGLALIIDSIERRLPQLTPVAYEGYDLSSGLSGDGIHHICGDKASIRRVQQALHEHANVESFWRPAHLRMSQQLATIKAAITL